MQAWLEDLSLPHSPEPPWSLVISQPQEGALEP